MELKGDWAGFDLLPLGLWCWVCRMLILAAGLRRYDLVHWSLQVSVRDLRPPQLADFRRLVPAPTAQDCWWREAHSAPPRQPRGHIRLHHHRVRDLQEAPALDVRCCRCQVAHEAKGELRPHRRPGIQNLFDWELGGFEFGFPLCTSLAPDTVAST